MTNTNVKLSFREKIGYSLGDLSANLIFQTFMTFLAFYYTDVYKVPSGAASAIIFTGGMIGAFFNPIMGMIADRTNTRWGKFRPWILWTSIPFGVMTILTFTTPDFSEQGKIIYAFITYILLVLVYSANNLPYAALSGVLTGNIAERNSISSYRFVAVMVAQFIVQVLALPLVMIVGDGDKAKGFEIVMTAFAAIGVVFFIITFLTTRERVIPKPGQVSSIKEDLGDLVRNRPWIIMLLVTVLVFITLSIKGGSYVYYFKNYVDEAALTSFFNKVGFNNIKGLVSDIGFSVFNAGGIIFMIVGIAFSKGLADKYGKRDVFGISLFISTLFVLVFVFFPPEAVVLMFVAQILHGFFYGLTIPLLWAMIADVADYSEWKNNRRATAIIFSAMIFGLKMGLSIGGAMVSGLLGIFGYDEALNVQPDAAINGIRMLVSVFPSIPFLIGASLLFFYPINKKMEVQIETELSEQRKH
jgi:Na+/melibiose symporter-like transporter